MTRRRGRVTLYRDLAGEWRIRRQASNGKVTYASEEGFVNYSYARQRAVDLFPYDRLQVMTPTGPKPDIREPNGKETP